MPTGVDGRTFRVLIVDDESSVRTFVDRALRTRGYETRVATTGEEALKLAEADGPFDLLLADLAMPGIRGDELARRLRQAHPGLKILYLTGYSDRLFEARTMLWEDEAFLEKPATVQGLLEAVSLLLVGVIPAPRATRVRVPGARAHIAGSLATLDTLSVTGALVQAMESLPVGSLWPLVLELQEDTIRLTGRVVSCTPSQDASGSAVPSFRMALAFVDPPVGVRRALQRACAALTV